MLHKGYSERELNSCTPCLIRVTGNVGGQAIGQGTKYDFP